MSKLKKIGKWVGIILLVMALIGGSLYFIYLRPFIEKMKVVTTINYDKELTLVIGGGGNSGILVSDSLVLVIDTKMDEAAQNLYERVERLAAGKPILVVNTHIHPDHVGGNDLYTNSKILAGGNYTKNQWVKEAGEKYLPNEWLKDRMDLKMGDETVSIINYGKNAHTESDVFVYLHNRKLLFGGDVILNKQNTIIMGNADPEGYLNAMDYLVNTFEIKHVVPGHGDFGGKEIISNFEQYFKDMKLAANDRSQRNRLLEKYKDWNYLPFFMSPEATMKAFKNK
jgi:cyclase